MPKRDWTDWVFAFVGSRVLAGRLDSSRCMLSPVYELKSELRTRPGAPAELHRVMYPVLLFASIDHVTLPTATVVVSVEDLTPKEKDQLALCLDDVEKTIGAMKTAEAGVEMAYKGPRLVGAH